MTESRVALVTGANRGIGLEVCRQLAILNYRIVLTARDLAKAEAAAHALRAHREIIPARLDVTDSRSLRALGDRLDSLEITVNALVNNAGILLDENTSILELAAADLQATFETNVTGPMIVSRAFVPGMLSRGYGRVVNVSSQAGQLSSMGTYAPAYSMSKAALNAFTRQLAEATKGTGVLVNSACPGWVRTDMGGRNAPKSVEQGADTIVWLATLPPKGPTGGFFSERKAIEW